VLALAIVVSSLLRKYLSVSIQGLDEIGGYVLAIVAAIGFSLALLERAHIRIEIVRSLLPRPAQAFLDLLALASLIFSALVLLWLGAQVLEQSVSMGAVAGTALRTPLVYPQSIWVAALGLFAFLTLYLAARCIAAMGRRDWDFVRQRLGGEDIGDEVAREMEDVRRRAAAQGAGARP
jgi:TRAP-type C4-dicarboxylate transport system permease small subunit